eukprot:COSAG01_NODE_20971_length_924_cov_12.460606_1_plen_65_part_00
MRDGWAVLQPTLTAQPSRSSQRTGPADLLPALRALDFLGPVLLADVACEYFNLCGYVFGFVWLQ